MPLLVAIGGMSTQKKPYCKWNYCLFHVFYKKMRRCSGRTDLLGMDNSFHFPSATKQPLIDPQDRDHTKGNHQIAPIFHREELITPPTVDFTEAVQLPVTPVEFVETVHLPQTDVSASDRGQENHLVTYGQQKEKPLSIADVLTLRMPIFKSLRKVDPAGIAELKTAKTPATVRIPQTSNAIELVETIETPASLIEPLLNTPAHSVKKAPAGKRLRSYNLLKVSEQNQLSTPPSTPAVEMQSITQMIQTISMKVQAVWAKRPYRVEKVKVMSAKNEQAYRVLVGIWIVANLYFWIWWLQPGHVGNPILFALMNLAFLYESTVLPSFYAFYLGHMRRPASVDVDLAEKMHVVKKVAVISLTVPGSESLEIVKQQMIAMTQISYPHDNWILVDKQHSPEIETLARELGVFYFSRHDSATWGESKVKHWNQSDPPFKAKTKAGNVNSWIDAYGHHYSHFTQLDIDHKPIRMYLHKVLGFFLDKKVKWVQAPSVYGNVENWAARGSAEQEFVLQGPLQMGFYGFCNTPFIIGSHCTYDIEAIREIGGFQPTRAEDHLDTVFLAARGYEGVFLPEVIAVGDGPETFETYMAQQFAWAYSMIQVLFNFTPKCIKNYTPRQALQFLFVQTWYVLWSLSMLMLFTLPVISLFLNVPIARVSYGEFILHSLPIAVVAFMIWAWSHSWHLPEKLELSWRGIILHIARWPIVVSALVQVIFRVQKPYMITVKGLHRGKQRPFALQPHYPYLALIALSLGACWFYLFTFRHSSVQGYLVFALQGAAILLLVYITALVKDIKDLMRDGISFGSSLLIRVKPLMLLASIIGIFVWTTWVSWNEIYSALVVYGNN